MSERFHSFGIFPFCSKILKSWLISGDYGQQTVHGNYNYLRNNKDIQYRGELKPVLSLKNTTKNITFKSKDRIECKNDKKVNTILIRIRRTCPACQKPFLKKKIHVYMTKVDLTFAKYYKWYFLKKMYTL